MTTTSTTWVLADESDGPTLAALVAANAPSFEGWQTICLEAIESVRIPDRQPHDAGETGWSAYVPALPARETYLCTLPPATVRLIANVDPVRADYVIREWNGEEHYSHRSCHEEARALLRMRRFARKALHQRKSIIVIWTHQLQPPTEADDALNSISGSIVSDILPEEKRKAYWKGYNDYLLIGVLEPSYDPPTGYEKAYKEGWETRRLEEDERLLQANVGLL